ncbi:uncharacterized protein LOC128723907 [Anopheles nili]|uniref:uncharacterized protein LOC128723907 n=1 Tax=Anopheles nili TaxID=185578 RepID=UPI00237ADC2A|nr:uncharacterized protein LOC128723907 [Anopheles nili]
MASSLVQLLVRFLVVAMVLVVVLEPAGTAAGSVGVAARQATASVPEDGDSSDVAVDSSDELLDEDESFDQNDGRSGGKDEPVVDENEDTTEHGPVTETTVGYNAVATTPKIVRPVKQLSRYEQGLEDYDEAADRVEREQTQQQQQTEQQQYNNMLKPMLTLFNVISTVLSSGRSMGAGTGRTMPTDDGNSGDGGNKTEIITVGEKSTSSSASGTGGGNENAIAQGRYIKGDPLNGYYDFVISEGSYKFWAVFQLVTAAVVIYSTLTAIYYSKVAPLTSDYDYIDYLNGGRSFAGARSKPAGIGRASGWSWDRMVQTSTWFGPAAQAFTIVMDAIERAPK